MKIGSDVTQKLLDIQVVLLIITRRVFMLKLRHLAPLADLMNAWVHQSGVMSVVTTTSVRMSVSESEIDDGTVSLIASNLIASLTDESVSVIGNVSGNESVGEPFLVYRLPLLKRFHRQLELLPQSLALLPHHILLAVDGRVRVGRSPKALFRV
jgi:hypothetical protein